MPGARAPPAEGADDDGAAGAPTLAEEGRLRGTTSMVPPGLDLPPLTFPPVIAERVGQDYEPDEWAALCQALTRPPRTTFVRVHTLRLPDRAQAQGLLEKWVQAQCTARGWPRDALPVQPLPGLPDVLVVHGSGPHHEDITPAPGAPEVIVDMVCGNAVLRGADIYAAGILAAPGTLRPGALVSVWVDLAGRCLRASKSYDGPRTFIGNGRSHVSRDDLYSSLSAHQVAGGRGVGVTMTQPLYRAPALADLFPHGLVLQNLPSILACHALAPRAGERILDMCAAPGGKTTHLATLSGNGALIVALERSQAKVRRMCEYVAASGLDSIHTYVCDSTSCVAPREGLCPPGHTFLSLDGALPPPGTRIHCLPRDSFDRILLDGPCSALGQRPCFHFGATKATLGMVAHHPAYQRSLLNAAVKLLRPGGHLLYSTCTFCTEENEGNVAYALATFPELELCPVDPAIARYCQPGRRSLSPPPSLALGEDGQGTHADAPRPPVLSEQDRLRCCRFDPGIPLGQLDERDLESIGFFFALFRKRSPPP